MTETRLDELPAELIERIASGTTARTVLALSLTCRRLKATCSTLTVYRALVLNSKTEWLLDRAVYSRFASELGLDMLPWAKFALADELAMELQGGLDGDFKGVLFERLLQWAPALIVTGHPFMHSSWLALKLSQVVHGAQLDFKGVFCYAAAMMGASDDGIDMVFTTDEVTKQLREDAMSARTRLKALRGLGAMAVMLRREQKRRTTLPVPILGSNGQRSGGGIFGLWEELQQNLAARHGRDLIERLKRPSPPVSVDISMMPPSGSSYAIPVPFSPLTPSQVVMGDRCGWEEWYERHVAALCMPESLKEEPWEGYFYDGRIMDEFCVMSEVHFTRAIEKPSGPTNMMQKPTLEVQGTGRDSVDNFVLNGEIEVDGSIMMRKTYRQLGFHWSWQLKMTPFGMFGNWGVRDDFNRNVRSMGAVWLWKRSWRKWTPWSKLHPGVDPDDPASMSLI